MKTKQDIYNEMCGNCPKAKQCHDEIFGCDEYEDKVLKLEMVERFMPMDTEMQKLMLFCWVDSYFQLAEALKKEKDENEKRIIRIQMETYQMMIGWFNTPAKEFAEAGYDNRQILKTYVKERYDDFMNEGTEGQA